MKHFKVHSMKWNLLFLLIFSTVIFGCKKDDIVKTVKVTDVSVSPTTKLLSAGESFTITATISPADASNKTVLWNSSKTSVAEVSSGGSVTAKSVGSATITATTADGGKTASCIVTVGDNTVSVTGVSVNPTSKTVSKGDSFTITVTITPADADNKTVIWSSLNTTIASVDNNGKVTALSEGRTVITVQTNDGNKTATCNVLVTTTNSNGAISDIPGEKL